MFEPMMGMDPDTIYQILPVSKRSSGMQIDASIVNPDMGKNYEQYPVENLQIPTLIIGAKDDKLSDFYAMEKAASRFLNSTLIGFDDGGHMMVGHGEEIEKALDEFMNSTNQ
ncbi:alpha/beta fold hydrolase [Paenibacillus lentus]|uniref:alpha/beta fold hydrolase n=1 Tax=Paenibacillus lentus TaxID=1338368 RepID=UPI0036D3BA0C